MKCLTVESFLNALPEPISMFITNLYLGWQDCRQAFIIWKFIMTNDYTVTTKKYFGINMFDEFYMRMNMTEWSN